MWSRQRLEVSSLKDEVKERIREWILTGELQPGQRIVETEIARTFGISQVPVREALRGLEEEGLVRTIKYKGAYVSDLVLKEIYHTFLLRTQIESNVLNIVVPRLNNHHFEELSYIVRQMKELEDDKSYVIQSGLDIQFHSLIVGWSGIEVYIRIWNALIGHVRRFITLMHPTYFSENHSIVVSQHEELLSVLKAGDVEAAKKVFTDHIMCLWNEQGTNWLGQEKFT